MNAQEFTSLADQVARQTPELAVHDVEIALRQPGVDVLQAAVAAAQSSVDAAHAAAEIAQADVNMLAEQQRQVAEAMPAGPDKDTALAAIDAAIVSAQATLGSTQAAIEPAQATRAAAQQALAGPAAQLAEVQARAAAIRASIAQCQAAMAASGLALDAGAMQAQRLAEARAAMWERIKAHRDHLSEHGGYLVSGKWFHSDAKSKTQQLALARKADKVQAAGGNMAAQFSGNAGWWKTMDGSFVAMTATLAQAIADAAELQDGAIFVTAQTHKTAMEAAADPLAYDFSGGWPAVFGA